MSKIQVSAMLKIQKDKIQELKKLTVEYINEVREKDSGTLQWDWFLSNDKTECEINETYESSQAALKHQSNLGDMISIIFRKIGKPYSVTIYGDPSPELLENARVAGLEAKIYSLLIGL